MPSPPKANHPAGRSRGCGRRRTAEGAGSVELEHEDLGDAVVVHVQGELDEHTAQAFRERLDALVQGRRVRYLVLDLRQLTFIDSSGIGALLGRYRRLQQEGGRMAIVRPAAHVRAVLELAGVARVVPVYASARQALQAR